MAVQTICAPASHHALIYTFVLKHGTVRVSQIALTEKGNHMPV